jgi:hypothetical protein
MRRVTVDPRNDEGKSEPRKSHGSFAPALLICFVVTVLLLTLAFVIARILAPVATPIGAARATALPMVAHGVASVAATTANLRGVDVAARKKA